MNTEKRQTETYILTGLDGIDPVTVYVTNYAIGQGKIVIECYGEAWAQYWHEMGPNTLEEFVLGADNDYLLRKFLKETMQTDFDQINELVQKRGFDFCVDNPVELEQCSKEMRECFGDDWYMDLPLCHTSEYKYLGRILNAIKGAFAPTTRG